MNPADFFFHQGLLSYLSEDCLDRAYIELFDEKDSNR